MMTIIDFYVIFPRRTENQSKTNVVTNIRKIILKKYMVFEASHYSVLYCVGKIGAGCEGGI